MFLEIIASVKNKKVWPFVIGSLWCICSRQWNWIKATLCHGSNTLCTITFALCPMLTIVYCKSKNCITFLLMLLGIGIFNVSTCPKYVQVWSLWIVAIVSNVTRPIQFSLVFLICFLWLRAKFNWQQLKKWSVLVMTPFVTLMLPVSESNPLLVSMALDMKSQNNVKRQKRHKISKLWCAFNERDIQLFTFYVSKRV